jgi:conjugal transfer pilus assembly protein TraK
MFNRFFMIVISSLLLANSSMVYAQTYVPGIGVPVVPNSIMKRNKSVEPTKDRAVSRDKVVSMKSNSNQFIIHVTPGINQVLPIAIGHINRIVTPFDTPFVNTVSDATIEAHENVLYVATSSERPVTLFVTPDVDDETMAISLTLSPRKIPPIEATLKFDEKVKNKASYSNKKAKKWEVSQPYVETIKSTLKKIALGKLPNGYSIGPVDKDSLNPTCIQEGFSFDFINGQYLKGHNLAIAIGTVRNTSTLEKEIDETECIDGFIVAASSWPKTIFNPGDISEMYIVMRTDLFEKKLNVRPSLLEQ